MKKKYILLILVIAIMGISYIGNQFVDHGPMKANRIHQHLEQKVSPEDETASISSEDFASHLPVVMINSVGEKISEEFSNCKIDIIDNQKTRNHTFDDPDVTTWARIKWRGNSSKRFDKKQYRISFVEERNSEKEVDYSVMGMRKESDWVLNGPYLDKTLMRNYMMYNISGEIMDWAPNVRYCEMFLDGRYMGLFLMVETVKVSPGRLNLKEVDQKEAQTSYLIERERYGDANVPINNFGTYTGKTVNEIGIEYPTKKKLSGNHIKYIKDDLSSIEKALYSLDYDEWDFGYANYIDVNSFIDYYLINEFCANIDAGSLSTFAYKDIKGKLTMGPVWDFNNSFDNYKHHPLVISDLYINTAPWYAMLMRDEIFVNMVIDRYQELRKTYLSDEYLLNYVDETRAYLGKAIDRNFRVWGYTFGLELLHPMERNPVSFDEAINQLKKVIVERGKFLDENIVILKQFCAESAVKEYN